MIDVYGRAILDVEADNLWLDRRCQYHRAESIPASDTLPDLSDPATVGWLLALVREKWGPLSFVGWDGKQWVVFDHMAATTDDGRAPVATGVTEAAALVAALEASNG